MSCCFDVQHDAFVNLPNMTETAGEDKSASNFAAVSSANKGHTFQSTPTALGASGKSYSKLIFLNRDRLEEAVEFVQKRLDAGQGETLLLVGCGGADGEPPGLTAEQIDASLSTLSEVCADKRVSAAYTVLRKQGLGGSGNDASAKQNPLAPSLAYVLVRRVFTETDFVEVRVAVVGNVDAGKSTLLGVLTHCELDDGRGKARLRLFRHKHEVESGRTSSVGNEILGFDASGQIINRPDHGHLDWAAICKQAAKVISFVDLAGHEKYLKTTVFGLTGHAPDFCMVIVGSNMGLVGMTKEHLGLALALGVPVFVVVTKIDMCPPNVLQETLRLLLRLLKSPACNRKMPLMVHSIDDVLIAATSFTSDRMCPIFQISSVTGQNLDLLRAFLNLLSGRGGVSCSMPPNVAVAADSPNSSTGGTEFVIDDTFVVPGVGTVVSGVTLRGLVRQGDTLLLGPDVSGRFLPVNVRTIQRRRLPVPEVRAGQAASFSLKKIKRSQIRKGMVLVSPDVKPVACFEFDGDILVLHHPTTMRSRYQAVVHVCGVRQTATIMSMSSECLRTGDHATIRLRFIRCPEYIRVGSKFIFREGRTKAIGTIIRVIPPSSSIGLSSLTSATAQSSNAPGASSSSTTTTTMTSTNANTDSNSTTATTTSNTTIASQRYGLDRIGSGLSSGDVEQGGTSTSTNAAESNLPINVQGNKLT